MVCSGAEVKMSGRINKKTGHSKLSGKSTTELAATFRITKSLNTKIRDFASSYRMPLGSVLAETFKRGAAWVALWSDLMAGAFVDRPDLAGEAAALVAAESDLRLRLNAFSLRLPGAAEALATYAPDGLPMPAQPSDMPVLLSPAHVATIRDLAASAGKAPDEILAMCLRRAGPFIQLRAIVHDGHPAFGADGVLEVTAQKLLLDEAELAMHVSELARSMKSIAPETEPELEPA